MNKTGLQQAHKNSFYDALAAGLQSYVSEGKLTASSSLPLSSTQFYSTITNRAAMTDITNDLRPSMGIERIPVQQLYEIHGEYGPNGERVFGVVGDDRQMIRLVGQWTVDNTTNGLRILPSGAATTDYVEITFFGTALNILHYFSGAGFTCAVSVDGGAETTPLSAATSYSTVMSGRNYAQNTPVTLASGLALGLHTVKIRQTGSQTVQFFGFEVVNASSSLNINPGTAYIDGLKVVTSSKQSVAYNSSFESGTLGTKGGRVVTYLKADGSIGKAVTPVDTTAKFLTATDHSNEEVVRKYHYREFGSNRADDFSTLTTTPSVRAFTLDDGSTNLLASTTASDAVNTIKDGIRINNTGGAAYFITFAFVGTGCDIFALPDGAGTTTNYSLTIDGVSQGALAPTFSSANDVKRIQLCSGLPYGTHVIKISQSTTATAPFGISDFYVYAPKKASVPAACMEIADYFVFANYAANATAGDTNIATGVLRKSTLRETVYLGTGWTSVANANRIGGFNNTSSTAGDSASYTFFGTGCDIRFDNSGTAATNTVTVDGSTNLTAYTVAVYGTGATVNTSTGVVTTTASTPVNSGISISGLTLGLHTVKISFTSGAGSALTVSAFDIITPIHAPKVIPYGAAQNTLPVGSYALSDNRKTSLLPKVSSQKAYVQAVGAAASPSTTSTSVVPVPDMSVVIKTSGGPVEISYTATVRNNTAGGETRTAVNVNGVQASNGSGTDQQRATSQTAGANVVTADTMIAYLPAGVHKIDLMWSVSGGTSTAHGTLRTLTAKEL